MIAQLREEVANGWHSDPLERLSRVPEQELGRVPAQDDGDVVSDLGRPVGGEMKDRRAGEINCACADEESERPCSSRARRGKSSRRALSA